MVFKPIFISKIYIQFSNDYILFNTTYNVIGTRAYSLHILVAAFLVHPSVYDFELKILMILIDYCCCFLLHLCL